MDSPRPAGYFDPRAFTSKVTCDHAGSDGERSGAGAGVSQLCRGRRSSCQAMCCTVMLPQELQVHRSQPRLLPDILLNASDKDPCRHPPLSLSRVLTSASATPEKPQRHCKEQVPCIVEGCRTTGARGCSGCKQSMFVDVPG